MLQRSIQGSDDVIIQRQEFQARARPDLRAEAAQVPHVSRRLQEHLARRAGLSEVQVHEPVARSLIPS